MRLFKWGVKRQRYACIDAADRIWVDGLNNNSWVIVGDFNPFLPEYGDAAVEIFSGELWDKLNKNAWKFVDPFSNVVSHDPYAKIFSVTKMVCI